MQDAAHAPAAAPPGWVQQLLTPARAEGAARALEALALAAPPSLRARVALAQGARAAFAGTAEGSPHVDVALATFARGGLPAATEAGAPLHYYLAQCSLAAAGGAPAQAPQLGAALHAALRDAPSPQSEEGAAPAWPPACIARALAAALPAGEPAAFQQANLWWCGGGGSGGEDATATAAAPPPLHCTGTHFDASHNLLLVLRGAKRVALLPPSAGPALGQAPLSHATPNHASAALWQQQQQQHDPSLGPADALARAACALPSSLPPALAARALVVHLPPGAALHIPEGWWHSVLSAPGTLAVNFWCSGAREAALPAALSHAPEAAERAHYAVRVGLLGLARAERGAMAREHARCARASAAGQRVLRGAPCAAAVAGAAAALLLGGPAAGAPPAGQAEREAALVAASAVRGGALGALLAVLDSGSGSGGGAAALGALLASLSAATVEALQAAWEAEEEEEEEEGGEGAAAAQQLQRGQGFQRVWGSAFGSAGAEGAGEAAAAWLAGARRAAMEAALARVVQGLHAT